MIDPRAYYTIYADRNETRYDAASVRKLYLRLERPQFYAMFGDIETGISEPELARYQRALNGGKAEYRGRNVAATAFIADSNRSSRWSCRLASMLREVTSSMTACLNRLLMVNAPWWVRMS